MADRTSSVAGRGSAFIRQEGRRGAGVTPPRWATATSKVPARRARRAELGARTPPSGSSRGGAQHPRWSEPRARRRCGNRAPVRYPTPIRPSSAARPAASVRVAAQLAEDAAHVHVDRARAQHEPRGDLAVGEPVRDEPHDLELPPREAGVGVPGRGAAPSCSSSDAPSAASCSAACAPSGAAPRRPAIRYASVRCRRRPGARRPPRRTAPGAQQDLRALERDVEVLVELDRPARGAARRRRRRPPPGPSRRARGRAPRARRDGRSAATIADRRLGARARLRQRAGRARSGRPPSAGPRRRSGGPRCAPTARARAGASSDARSSSPSSAASQASAAALSHSIEMTSSRSAVCRQRSSSGRAASARPRQASTEPTMPSATSVSSALALRHDQLFSELERLVPVAQLAQHVGHAVQADLLEAAALPCSGTARWPRRAPSRAPP